MKTKMNQPVRWHIDGVEMIFTPRELLDRGLGEVQHVANFKGSPRGAVRKATFVAIKGTSRCVEVSGYVAAKA